MDALPLLLLAILTFLTLLAVSILATVYFRMFRATLFTVMQAKVTVTILDRSGNRATFSKRMSIRANHKGLTQYIHRNLSADGSMQNFRVDRVTVQPQKDAGDYLVYVNFPRPLNRGETLPTILDIDLTASFPSTTEWVTYLLTYPTKELTVEVNLPSDRPASKAEVYCLRGGEIEPVDTKPQLLDNNCRIVWTATDLRDLGWEYRIQWTWPEV